MTMAGSLVICLIIPSLRFGASAGHAGSARRPADRRDHRDDRPEYQADAGRGAAMVIGTVEAIGFTAACSARSLVASCSQPTGRHCSPCWPPGA